MTLSELTANTANTARHTEFVPVRDIRKGDALTGLWHAKTPVTRVVRHRDGRTSVTTVSVYGSTSHTTTMVYPAGDALWVYRATRPAA